MIRLHRKIHAQKKGEREREKEVPIPWRLDTSGDKTRFPQPNFFWAQFPYRSIIFEVHLCTMMDYFTTEK